ncbi:MAG TPA: hypothetical protein VNE71_12285 [Myxococcota bacterium]|nr:hypothetical protein [Myxococcota bacterium]
MAAPFAQEPLPAVPSGGRGLLLRELPSIALVLLACVQLALVHVAELSPWKGGGFGMFATNDHGSFRSVRVFAEQAGGERRLGVPSERLQALFRVRELPNAAALRAFAGSLAPLAPDANAIRVEVWRVCFDGELHAKTERLAAETWRSAP